MLVFSEFYRITYEKLSGTQLCFYIKFQTSFTFKYNKHAKFVTGIYKHKTPFTQNTISDCSEIKKSATKMCILSIQIFGPHLSVSGCFWSVLFPFSFYLSIII
jgi:hypothetical protein